MARTKISEFSATAADNTDIDNIDIAEGCAPSGINNAIRELMAQLKDMQTGASGDTFTLTTVNSTTVDTTNLEVSNLKAKDGTAAGSIADSTGVVTLTSVTGTTADYTNLEVTNLKAKDGTASASIADSTGLFTHATNTVFPAGAVGTPSITTAGDTNTGIFFPAADTIAFSEGGVEAARFDSSGNLGIGTSSPNQKLQVVGSNGTGFAGATLQNSNANVGLAGVQFSSDTTYSKAAIAQVRENANGNGSLVFYVDTNTDAADWSASDEKMRISSGGSLLVATTSQFSGFTGRVCVQNESGLWGLIVKDATGNTAGINFLNTAGSQVGSVTINASSVSFNTSSDYRLKENVAPMAGALAKVAALKPVTYTWKSTGEAGQGFIAHELQEVMPDCVAGEKDAVELVDDLDANGKKIGTKEVPRYQGVDTSFLVATLVAAIQELKAEFDAYKAAHP